MNTLERKKMLESGIYIKNSLVGMDWLDVDGKIKTMCGLCKLVKIGDNLANKLYEKDDFIAHLVTAHSDEEIKRGMLDKKK